MDEAKLAGSGTTIGAEEFAQLAEGRRAALREQLRCPACDVPAYFIRAATNGRSACFGARPHADGCTLATASGIEISGALDDEDPLVANADEFRIRRVDPPAMTHVDGEGIGDSTGGGRGRRHVGSEPGGASTPSMSLRRILSRLLREPDFRTSTRRIRTPDGYYRDGTVAATAKNFVDATRDDVRSKRLWWGTIYYPNPGVVDGVRRAWLRSRTKGAPALLLDGDLLETILGRLNLDDPEDLVGASFIWWGQLHRTRSGDRFFLLPDATDLDWLDFRAAREDPL